MNVQTTENGTAFRDASARAACWLDTLDDAWLIADKKGHEAGLAHLRDDSREHGRYSDDDAAISEHREMLARVASGVVGWRSMGRPQWAASAHEAVVKIRSAARLLKALPPSRRHFLDGLPTAWLQSTLERERALLSTPATQAQQQPADPATPAAASAVVGRVTAAELAELVDQPMHRVATWITRRRASWPDGVAVTMADAATREASWLYLASYVLPLLRDKAAQWGDAGRQGETDNEVKIET